MNEEKQKPLIFEAIKKIKLQIGHIGKGRRNLQQGYSFRGIDDLYNYLHEPMSENGVFSVPKVLSEHREERPTKAGGVMIYTVLKVRYRFYATDGSFFDAVTVGEASDSGDKASNKAMSAAHKYALIQVFDIPTNEDNDTENNSPEFKEKKSDASKPNQKPPVKREPEDKGPTPISDAQTRKIMAITKGVPETDILAFTLNRFKKSALKELTMKEASQLIGLIDSGEFGKWLMERGA